MTETVRWIATLSDGTQVKEHEGSYGIIPGERKPWVRLTEFSADNNLVLTSLQLEFKDRTISLPSLGFDRFGLGDKSCAPDFYSLQYIVEGVMGGQGGVQQSDFIELVAHFPTFEVHFIQGLSQPKSWIVVTNNYTALAPSPSTS